MRKVRSTYVDHLSTHERSKIHVPCPIVYVRRSRDRNTTSELFLVRVKAFPWVLCEAHHIEAHGMGGLDEEELLEGIGYAVLSIGAGDEVRTALDILGGIAHGDTRAGQLDHLEVVVVVTDGDEVLWGQAEDVEEASERTTLIHTEGDELEEVVA